MATVDGLRSRLRLLQVKIPLPTDPKSWFFCIHADEEIPERYASQIREQDSVVVRVFPAEWLSGRQGTSCGWVTVKGKTTVLFREESENA